jgi:hypothetical protein
MRFLAISAIFSVVLLLSSAAQARSWWDYIFPPPVPDFEKPYLNEGKIPHNSTWSHDTWTPEGWAEGAGSAEFMMQDLYKNDIVTDQYEDDGAPVLEVGRNFMNLSQQDKQRVAAFVDSAFGITKKAPDGMFYIYQAETEEPIGYYNADGLHLQ